MTGVQTCALPILSAAQIRSERRNQRTKDDVNEEDADLLSKKGGEANQVYFS